MSGCNVCPRACARRSNGFCGGGDTVKVALIEGKPYMRHMFEEPPVSLDTGSGAIFFYGCNMACVYCQNKPVSGRYGEYVELSIDALSELMVNAAEGAHTLSLVTAGHYIDGVAAALKQAKRDIKVPVVYNSNAYEKAEKLKSLDGLVDIYLPDFKYSTDESAVKYSNTPDYVGSAMSAVAEMYRQTGAGEYEDGLMKRGLIIRHLVLPGLRREGMEIMRIIADRFEKAQVSIMRQYTPEYCTDATLKRRITSYEYDSVVNCAIELGLSGFIQQKGCERTEYTPRFSVNNRLKKD